MGKIRIVTFEQAAPVSTPERDTASVETRAYLNGAKDPLHLLRHRLAPGAGLTIAGVATDMMVFIFAGSVSAGGLVLTEGASLVVEYGAALEIVAEQDGAVLLVFNEAVRSPSARPGGHIHLLPRESVPTLFDLGMQNEMGGGIHADAACPTCMVWLHENDFHCRSGTTIPVHAHSEDEIIFVTAGDIKLGQRLYGPGTAIAVAADTQYGFEAPPTGLSFINFRAASPTVTTSRGISDEAAMWISRLGRPPYTTLDRQSAGLAPAGSAS